MHSSWGNIQKIEKLNLLHKLEEEVSMRAELIKLFQSLHKVLNEVEQKQKMLKMSTQYEIYHQIKFLFLIPLSEGLIRHEIVSQISVWKKIGLKSQESEGLSNIKMTIFLQLKAHIVKYTNSANPEYLRSADVLFIIVKRW